MSGIAHQKVATFFGVVFGRQHNWRFSLFLDLCQINNVFGVFTAVACAADTCVIVTCFYFAFN